MSLTVAWHHLQIAPTLRLAKSFYYPTRGTINCSLFGIVWSTLWTSRPFSMRIHQHHATWPLVAAIAQRSEKISELRRIIIIIMNSLCAFKWVERTNKSKSFRERTDLCGGFVIVFGVAPDQFDNQPIINGRRLFKFVKCFAPRFPYRIPWLPPRIQRTSPHSATD